MENILLREIEELNDYNNNNYKSKNFKLIENLSFKDFGLEFKNYKNVKSFYIDYLKLYIKYN
tara:strand:- start:179 stop:364 length:186 start_codon:yes stop_codon:yes gene_type:complete